MVKNNIINNDLGVLTTKGDILACDGIINTRQGVGLDTYVLTADSTMPNGVDWKPAASSGGLSNIFAFMGS